MGLFSKKPEPPAADGSGYRGGCAKHDMRGPTRKTTKEADRDANAHSDRMHGGFDGNPNAYIEYVPPRDKS